VWMSRRLQELAQDLRYGVRSLTDRPTFTLTALAMLVLGLGLTASLFTVFNAAFLRPWAVPDSGRVFIAESTWMQDRVRTTSRGAKTTVGSNGLPYMSWQTVLQQSKAADYTFVELNPFRVTLQTPSGLPFLRGAFVSDNFFDVMRVRLEAGAGFTAASITSAPVAVISDSTWRRYFNQDAAIVGKTVVLSNVPTTIVGVSAQGFEGLPPDELNVVVPASAASQWRQNQLAASLATTDPGLCCIEVQGRLRPGFSRADAAADLKFLMQRYAADHGATPTAVSIKGTSTLSHRGVNSSTAALIALVAAGCLLVWLLACTNVWNLELARGLEREREVMIRLSLGASRGRVVRQFLTEGLILALMAGVFAFAVANWLPTAAMNYFDGPSPFGYTPDSFVAVVIAGFAIAAALLFSLAPALQVTRIRLRAAPATASLRGGRIRGVMLATQVAIGAVLILTGSLLARSVSHALGGHADFAVGDVSVVTISAPTDSPEYSDHLQLRAAWARTAATMASEGIQFAPTTQVPISNRKTLAIAAGDSGRAFQTLVYSMAASGMSVLDIPIVIGRNYSDDRSRREVVVNQSFATRMWPTESPLGKTVDLDFPEKGRFSVVGVARDAHLTSFGEIRPLIHQPLPASVPIRLQALVRRGPANESSVRRLLSKHEPALSVEVAPLADSIRLALRDAISGATIAGTLGALSLLLAIVGIFGVFSFVVEERRREIGIRLALGADHRQVGASILRPLAWPLAGGLVAGLTLSIAAGALLRGYLLGISPLDPIAYLAAAGILAMAAFAAAFVPMKRALGLDPAITLRQE
jgi:predicted permease